MACRQFDFWPELIGRSSATFARLAYCAAGAPRPQLCEDAGAAAAAAGKAVAPLRGAPHGNHGENNNGVHA